MNHILHEFNKFTHGNFNHGYIYKIMTNVEIALFL